MSEPHPGDVLARYLVQEGEDVPTVTMPVIEWQQAIVNQSALLALLDDARDLLREAKAEPKNMWPGRTRAGWLRRRSVWASKVDPIIRKLHEAREERAGD